MNGARIEAKAKSTPFSDTRESVLHLDLHDFDVTPFVAYSPVPLPFRLTSAKLGLGLDVTFAQPPGKAPSIVIAGRTDLKSVAMDFLMASRSCAWRRPPSNSPRSSPWPGVTN